MHLACVHLEGPRLAVPAELRPPSPPTFAKGASRQSAGGGLHWAPDSTSARQGLLQASFSSLATSGCAQQHQQQRSLLQGDATVAGGATLGGDNRRRAMKDVVKSLGATGHAYGVDWRFVWDISDGSASNAYTAPEVANKLCDESLDIYALGHLILRVLVASIPPNKASNETYSGAAGSGGAIGEDAESMATRWRTERPANLNQAAWDLVQDCCADDPFERPNLESIERRLASVLRPQHACCSLA